MTQTIDDYRCKFINKVLFAGSQEEVSRFIDAAMRGLEEHKVNGHIVARFVDKVISDLEQFDPLDYDAQQWTNIKMARILFNKIKRSIQSAAHH